MPAAPRVKLPTRTGGGSASDGAVRSPANPGRFHPRTPTPTDTRAPQSPANPGRFGVRSPAHPGPRGFGPRNARDARGPRMPADPILQLARQQKQQLSDLDMRTAQQIDSDWQRLVAVPLGVHLTQFAQRYQQALDALAQQQQDASYAEDDESADGGGFGGGAPISPANPGPRGPDAFRRGRGGANPGRFAINTSGNGGGASPTVPTTWLLDAHGGDAHGLLRSAKGQIGKFAQVTQKTIAQHVVSASAQGMTDGQALLAIALQPLVDASGGDIEPDDLLTAGTAAARQDAKFALLSQLMNSGGPLAQMLGSMPEETADSAYRTLLYGLGHGENPQALISDLQQILGASRSRALTISRTEMLNAYRGAQLDNYRANSDVVQGWIWLADMASACPLCVDLNGEIHPLDDDMISHPRCRCSPAPYTKSWDAILSPLGMSADELGLEDTSLQVESGEDWFARQDEATQRTILGPAAFNAYQQGDLKLSDLVGRNADGSYYQKSLKEAGLNFRDYLPTSGAAKAVESEVASEAESVVTQEAAQTAESAAAAAATETESAVEGLGSVEEIQARESELNAMFEEAMNPPQPWEDGESPWDKSQQRLADQLVDNPEFMRLADKLAGRMFSFGGESAEAIAPDVLASRGVYQLITGYHTYAGGSSSASPLQIALQEAMRKEFGLTSAVRAYSDDALAAAMREYGENVPAMQAFLRQMYDNTQADLAERGITEIQVFRGMSFTEGQLPDGLTLDGSLQSDEFALQPISSFSTNLNTAMQYANGTDFGALAGDYGAVVATIIPADQVLSTGFTGFGAFYMSEVTTLGGAYDMLIIGSENPSFTLDDLYTVFSGE